MKQMMKDNKVLLVSERHVCHVSQQPIITTVISALDSFWKVFFLYWTSTNTLYKILR